MRPSGSTALLAAVLAAAFVYGISAGAHERAREPAASPAGVYTCPMHPEVASDAPGRCPKCKMKLVPR